MLDANTSPSDHRCTNWTVAARSLLVTLLGLHCVFSASAQEHGTSSDRDKLIVETILRMESFDYSKAPEKVTGAVTRYLNTHPATEEYFTLIDRYRISEESETLLRIATEDTEGQGGRALQALLSLGAMNTIVAAAVAPDTPPSQRAKLLRALALSGQLEALNQLGDIATGGANFPIRVAAATALGTSRPGEKTLLALASQKRLPADLVITVAGILHVSADSAVREEAAHHLTMPASLDATPLPPISELSKRSGNAVKGMEIYQRACIICHQIGAAGTAFGPALTEIGDKLPKEALYSSILDPAPRLASDLKDSNSLS